LAKILVEVRGLDKADMVVALKAVVVVVVLALSRHNRKFGAAPPP
jgi:hypothetical protein